MVHRRWIIHCVYSSILSLVTNLIKNSTRPDKMIILPSALQAGRSESLAPPTIYSPFTQLRSQL